MRIHIVGASGLVHGAAIAPGGRQHAAYETFMTWAAASDGGPDVPERCRRLHEQWLPRRPCPVQRFLDAGSTDEHVSAIMGGPR
jgi:hypothetical protein